MLHFLHFCVHCPLYNPLILQSIPLSLSLWVFQKFSDDELRPWNYEESFAVRSRASQDLEIFGWIERKRKAEVTRSTRTITKGGPAGGGAQIRPHVSARISSVDLPEGPANRSNGFRSVRSGPHRASFLQCFSRDPQTKDPTNSSVKIRAATGSTVSRDKEGELRRAPARRLAIPPWNQLRNHRVPFESPDTSTLSFSLSLSFSLFHWISSTSPSRSAPLRGRSLIYNEPTSPVIILRLLDRVIIRVEGNEKKRSGVSVTSILNRVSNGNRENEFLFNFSFYTNLLRILIIYFSRFFFCFFFTFSSKTVKAKDYFILY